mgnify:FL=1
MTEDNESGRVADRMRRLCSRREYCISDIRRKIAAALDGDQTRTDAVLDILVKENYINDGRYARAFARDKSALSGWGASKIRYMLSMKGVARDVIDEALDEVDADKAASRLDKLMENKYKSLADDPQCRLKMLRFGLGRGYGYDEVEEVVCRLMKTGR